MRAFLAQAENPQFVTSDLAARFSDKKSTLNSIALNLARRSSVEDAVLRRKVVALKLPPLPPALVADLLQNTAFKSVFGQTFSSVPNHPENDAYAAVADGFNIFPTVAQTAKATGPHHVALTTSSCVNCHNTTLRHVTNFNPPKNYMRGLGIDDSQGHRDWYGHQRGSLQQPVAGYPGLFAGVFTMPTLDPKAPLVGNPVTDYDAQTIRPNPALASTGLITWAFQNLVR